jgi:hypothetical protein
MVISMNLNLNASIGILALSIGLTASGLSAETLSEHQQRVASELEAENLLVVLHHTPLAAELEPCINGAVSPSGRYADAAVEEAVNRLADSDTSSHLAESAYFDAFNAGRIALVD